jgi:glycolate oxidase
MNEIVAPRSFVLTAKGILTGDLKPSSNMAENIYQCVECGACNVKCPPGVKIEEIVNATRNRLIDSGIQPPTNIKKIKETIKHQGRLHGETGYKSVKKIARAPFNAPIKEEADVLYYLGCTASQLELDQARAMIMILKKAQVDFTVIKDEVCCGLPLYVQGFKELFDKKAEENMDIFNQLKPSTIITTCPGCYRAFSKLYPKAFGATKINHSTQFISNLIEEGDLKLSTKIQRKITYHDPCDLGRHSGLFDPPREVIKAFPNVQFIESNRNRMESQCCGAGGGFASAYPEIAKSICATRLRKDIEPTEAEMLVTSCPNCVHQFKETVNSIKNINIEVFDLTELVANSIK